MTCYSIYDASGRVIRNGTCAEEDIELQAGRDEFLHPSHLPLDHIRHPETGEFHPSPPPPAPPPPTVDALRRAAYPPIAHQLDALWHAMHDGVLPRVAAFYDPILAVKRAHPKET